jgi:acetoin utilization protein AcuB
MHAGRVRHMPVVEDGRVIGVVSDRDLLATSLSKTLDFDAEERRTFLRSVDATEVMTQDLVTVTPGATLSEAADVMMKHRISCLPVVDEAGALLGLVTETDLVRAALLGEESESPQEH